MTDPERPPGDSAHVASSHAATGSTEEHPDDVGRDDIGRDDVGRDDRGRDDVRPEDVGHPRGTLAIVVLYGLLFALGWVALYVFKFLEQGAPTS